ncbi:hypothetical protein [Acetobacterium bakii]|uniref:ABC transporter permease n=1 Tax=Acetobacterium bakii TaxID=52689 RepID=A0A0L6U0S2_9FIRM|nr:hypothetical protein [Acetobacterium bakii]KNZ42121.1 hypothetical protein AKG39_08115 [Acetobacterium bakii]
MSLPLFLKDIKNNIVLLLVFGILMSIYLSVIIYMYDPSGAGALMDMLSLLPVRLVNALGFPTVDTGLTGFIAGLYYGFLIYLFPMVYCIVLGNRLVAKWVYEGSFISLLSTPNSRIKIIVTQGAYMLFSIILLFSILYFVGIGVSENLFKGLLDISVFGKLNFSACLMTMAIGMICFFFSCIFNDTRLSLAFGAGIPVLFFLLNMLGGLSERTAFLKDYSLYSSFNGMNLVSGTVNAGTINSFFIMVILLLFAGSIAIFQFKRLPI